MAVRSLKFSLLLSLSELGLLSVFFILYCNSSYRQTAKAREAGHLQRIADLIATADTLKCHLTVSNHGLEDLDQLADDLRSDLMSSRKLLFEVKHERDQFQRELYDSEANLARTRDLLNQICHELAENKDQLADLQRIYIETERQLALSRQSLKSCRSRLAALTAWLERQPRVAKAVAGIKGELDRVVILFDCSRSMLESGRWEQARDVVKTWAEFLDIGECALITFSRTAKVFTLEGEPFLNLRGANGEKNKEVLLQYLGSLDPDGGTNTLSAFELAYRLNVEQGGIQTIILFSDGAPNNGLTSLFDPKAAEEIFRLCGEHREIPVNTVGLGNYFDRELSGFLMRVAGDTNGAFLGR